MQTFEIINVKIINYIENPSRVGKFTMSPDGKFTYTLPNFDLTKTTLKSKITFDVTLIDCI
jgi:hypothetical protein